MRALVLLLVAACSSAADGGTETEPPEAMTDCAPDATATVYSCGSGYVIDWPQQTMVCGALDGACAPDPSVLVAVCDSGGWVLSFPSEPPPTCAINNDWEPPCIDPPEDLCGRTCSGLEFVGCACAFECAERPGMVRSCHVASGTCTWTAD